LFIFHNYRIKADFDDLGLKSITGSVLSIASPREKSFNEKNEEIDDCVGITVGILKEMTNLSLLRKNCQFFLMVMCNFCFQFGFFLPLIYMPIIAKELNISNVTLLIGIIGKYFYIFCFVLN
jgi:hypothetical protein